ncbi:MAG: type II toxin-antitoxin system Phd/YefM family antitoxin [Dehalococcoidia bacterium]
MKQITIRQLRQQASSWLRQVQAGEAFEVTDRGHPVALLVPKRPAGPLEELAVSGRLTPASGDLLDLGAPLPPHPGQELPSVTLEQMRSDER